LLGETIPALSPLLILDLPLHLFRSNNSSRQQKFCQLILVGMAI